jgi:hypothetical protein
MAETQNRVPDPDHVAVAQRALPAQTLPVDERPVAREAVVLDRPARPAALQMGVDARYARIPPDLQVAAGSAAEHEPVAVQRHQHLGALVVAQEQERRAAARCVKQGLQHRRADGGSQDRPFLSPHGASVQGGAGAMSYGGGPMHRGPAQRAGGVPGAPGS